MAGAPHARAAWDAESGEIVDASRVTTHVRSVVESWTWRRQAWSAVCRALARRAPPKIILAIKFMRRPPHTHSSRPESLYKSARAPGRRLKLTHTRSHRCADGKTGADPAPPLRRRMVPLVVSIARPRARVVRRIRGSHTHTRAQPSTHNTPFTPQGWQASGGRAQLSDRSRQRRHRGCR